MPSRSRDWRITAAPLVDSGEYTQLARIATELGVDHGGGVVLRVGVDGLDVAFELHRDEDGAWCRMSITVAFDDGDSQGAAPVISFRKSRGSLRSAHARDINGEVPTGDAAFDRDVSVDSGASIEETRRLLARDATRQAVSNVLDCNFHEVQLTRRSAVAIKKSDDASVDATESLDVLEQLLVLARGGGPKHARQRRGVWLPWVGVAAFQLGAGSAHLAMRHWPTGATLPLCGAAFGLGLSLALRPVVVGLVRGDGQSYLRSLIISSELAVALAGLMLAAFVTVNGALDTAPGTEHEGRVVFVATEHDPVSDRVDVTLVWNDDGATELLKFSPPVEVGTKVLQTRFAGRLGFPWHHPVRLVR